MNRFRDTIQEVSNLNFLKEGDVEIMASVAGGSSESQREIFSDMGEYEIVESNPKENERVTVGAVASNALGALGSLCSGVAYLARTYVMPYSWVAHVEPSEVPVITIDELKRDIVVIKEQVTTIEHQFEYLNSTLRRGGEKEKAKSLKDTLCANTIRQISSNLDEVNRLTLELEPKIEPILEVAKRNHAKVTADVVMHVSVTSTSMKGGGVTYREVGNGTEVGILGLLSRESKEEMELDARRKKAGSDLTELAEIQRSLGEQKARIVAVERALQPTDLAADRSVVQK